MTAPIVRAGGWLFRHRTLIPLPLAFAILVVPAPVGPSPALVLVGAILVAAGEAIRLWGVRHIGAVSRTRSERLGPLVASGPFAIVRNPLYLGNILVWIGFAASARLPWLVPVFLVALGVEYHAIVRWEEQLLEARLGDGYRAYAVRVPRWVPDSNRRARRERGEKGLAANSAGASVACSWRETLFSERGTLIAIAVGYALLYVKEHV